MTIAEFQKVIGDTYRDKDMRRGKEKTFMWFVEEVGELSDALLKGNDQRVREEFSDVFAWFASLANVYGVDLEQAIAPYRAGCPGCKASPCRCEEKVCR